MANPEFEKYIRDNPYKGVPRKEIAPISKYTPKLPNKKIIPFIVIASFLIAGILLAGFFIYKSLDTGEQIQQAPVPTARSGRLKIAYVKRQNIQDTFAREVITLRQDSIITIDLVSGKESTVFTSKEESLIDNLAWSGTNKKIAFSACCVRDADIWIMNVDGSDLRTFEQEHKRSPLLALQWSPDGTMLSYLLFTGEHTVGALRVIDAATGSELIFFDATEESGGMIRNYFWMPDSKSIIVNGLGFEEGQEESYQYKYGLQTWQLSIDNGNILRTLDNSIIIFGILNNQIIYSKTTLSEYMAYYGAEADDLNMFISDINGENERILFSFSDDKYCKKNYMVGGTPPIIVDNKIAFVVGGDEDNSECAGRRAVIFDLKTKETVETNPFVNNLAWSPDGKFLAIVVALRVTADRERVNTRMVSSGSDSIDLYTPDGKFIKTLLSGCPDGCSEKWTFFYDDTDPAIANEEMRQTYEENITGDTKRKSDMFEIILTLEGYYDGEGSYPVQTTCGPLPSKLVEKGYIPKLPEDPSGPSWPYQYASNADGTYYVFRADLENANSEYLDRDVDGLVLTCDCNDIDGSLCFQP